MRQQWEQLNNVTWQLAQKELIFTSNHHILYEPKTPVNYQFFHSKYRTSKSKIQHFL
jgi:hypothetical protein